jgi:hypothetical protein
MRFWIREVAGWVLVALGLYLFLICLSMMLTYPLTIPQYLEAGWPAIFGIVVFRGGIHLLKVAVAARICLQPEKTPKERERLPS